MAKEYYLDEEGVQRLVDFFTLQFGTRIDELEQQIKLLNKTDGTPGSIQRIIDDTIANTSISDLKDEELAIYGGSASEVIPEEGAG